MNRYFTAVGVHAHRRFPVEKWYDIIGDPTFADAILDRLVHHGHRIALDGPSMRKTPRPGIVADTNEAEQ